MIMPTLLYIRKKKMVGYRLSVLMFFLFSVLLSPMALAAKSVNLKTIEVELPTGHGTLKAEIHFDTRDLEVALKVKKVITTDLIRVINYFQHVPVNTVHFNVDPYLRLTNGNARTFPTNIINLYNFPASNSEHLIVMEDWIRGLVFHEYIHITHLDQTSDFVEVGRNIFGSIAKLLPGVVPRWFTEGIATWGESHLIDGGRLHNPLFRKELLIQFLRVEYCTTIDCLDAPGVYPQGQLSYWAGAHFIEYIENKKPNTVKCLVEENSGKVPFFLNNAFETCTGQTAQALFEEFRQSFINSQPPITPESEAWGDKISNAFGSDDLQKGIVLDGSKLYKAEKNRFSEALVSYDLQDNVNMMVAKYSFPISDIAGITHVPQADNDQSEEGKFLIVSFNEDMDYRGDNRVWRLVNTETLLIETKLPQKNDPSYVIGLGNNRYLTASFVDGKWIIERQKVDLTTGKLVDSDVVHHFASEVNLTYFKKVGQRVYIKLNRGDLGSALYVSELTLEKFYKIHEGKEFFDLPIVTENFVVIKEKENFNLYEIGSDFKNITRSSLDKNQFNRITSAEITNDRVLVLENRLKTKEMPISESMSYLKKNINSLNIQSFPKLYHMQPYYWFIATGSNENLSSFGAMTSLSDPMELNVLNATVLAYEDGHVGGNLDFFHKFSSVTDLWSMSAFFNQEYSKTDFNNALNDTTEGSIGTNYSFLMSRWTWIPGLYLSSTKTSDFISDRSTKAVGFNTVLNYSAASFDDYFQNLMLKMKLQSNYPNINGDYISTQAQLSMRGRFHERIEGGLKTSYGKLFKSGFRGGVIYGGGTSNFTDNRWHDFYGIPYSNAYGNEIFTARLYLDWNFWYIYKGHNLFPFYFKEAHLLLGREVLAADRIIIDNTLYREKTIHSFFIGPRIKANVAYYIPLDIDIIYSATKRPSGGPTKNQVEVNISSEF